MIELLPVIDKKFILTRISQEEIFEKYLGRSITVGEKFCSPLRDDHNPTCSIKKLGNGRLYFKDWSGHFAGDCFDLVKFLYGCNFYEACKIIATDFKLISGLNTGKKFKRKPKKYIYGENFNKDKANIKVQWKNFTKSDISFWKECGINIAILHHYNVAPVQFVWIDDVLVYSFKVTDPAYGYWFNDGEIKIYFPKREQYRFLCNTSSLQGYKQLPEKGEILVITKSLKDVMFLRSCLIPSVAPQSESSIITLEQYKNLSSRFNKIYSLYDFDATGVRSSNKMKKLYNTKPKFFTNGRFNTPKYEGKDITDIVKYTNSEIAKERLNNLIESDTWFGIIK